MRNQAVIRTLIREMLNEVMRTPFTDTIHGIRIDVETKKPDEISILLSKEEYNEFALKDIRNTVGTLVAKKKPRTDKAPCLDAWEISWAHAKAAPGWGPFLYHLMLQIADTRDGNGVMADRSEVSKDALGVWQKFNEIAGNGASGIEKLQLDDYSNTLTDTFEDNCSQFSNKYHFEEPQVYDDREGRTKWLLDSPITKVYKRKPGARDWRAELIELGIYYENGVQVSPWDAE